MEGGDTKTKTKNKTKQNKVCWGGGGGGGREDVKQTDDVVSLHTVQSGA